MDSPMTIMLVFLGITVLVSALLSFAINTIRYIRLKKFLPRIIEENDLDPENSYLVGGNRATSLTIFSFGKESIKVIFITNYWIRKLSIVDTVNEFKYSEMDYVLDVPRFSISIIFANELPSFKTHGVKGVIAAAQSISIDTPWVYKLSDHRLFNLSWINGKIHSEIIQHFKDGGVEVRLTQKGNRAKKQMLLIFMAIVFACLVVAIYTIPKLDCLDSFTNC